MSAKIEIAIRQYLVHSNLFNDVYLDILIDEWIVENTQI